MNKPVIFGIVGVVALGVISIIVANTLAGPQAGGTKIQIGEQTVDSTATAPKPAENSFTIMTPEEKAAFDAEQARLAAERAAAASSTASTTASSTDERAEGEVELEGEIGTELE